MTIPAGLIILSQRATGRLILVQSILIGAQSFVAAGALADVVGVKVAALSVIAVSSAQLGLNAYLSKVVTESGTHVQLAVNRAEVATDRAQAAAEHAETVAQQTEG